MQNKELIIGNAKRVFDMEIASLEHTKNLLNTDFEKAVNLIASCNKIIVSGIGKSGIIGQKIAATLSSTGTSAVFLHPVEALHGDIGMVQKGDVAILLSKSGNTSELVQLIPYLKMRAANIISIVGSANSFLARNSDAILNASVEREACPYNLAPTTSTTVSLALGDALAVCLMKVKNITLDDFSRLHPLGQIGRTVTLSVKDVMHHINDIATISHNKKFHEALIEMSRKPLGCICVIDKEGTLDGILTDGDIRRVLQKHDNYKELVIGNIMTKSPITINDSAPLVEALALMENRAMQISVLPVVKDRKLIGLIRIHDIVGQ